MTAEIKLPKLRALLLEDNTADAEALVSFLQEYGFDVDWRRAESRAEYVEHLTPALDLILADYNLPSFDAPSALRMMQEKGFDIPFIIVSGFVGEEAAVAAIKQGADDYLLKDRLARLGPAVAQALEKRRLRAAHQGIQDRLRESEANLAQAQHLARLGSWERDLRDDASEARQRLHWSDEVFRIFGYEPGQLEVSAENFFNAVHPDDRERIREAVAKSIRENSPYQIDHRIILPNGVERIVHEQSEIVLDPHTSRPLKMVGTIQDITERQNLEAQLRQAQKMESIGRLAGGVAHDFNNLLTVIQGHASLLLAQPSLAMHAVESIRDISLAAERAANLTRQLLTFSRKQVMQPAQVDLNDTIQGMTDLLQRLLGEDVSLRVRSSPKPAFVFADTPMMEQVLLNLAVNSRDAMPKGGRLSLSTSHVNIDRAYAAQHPAVSVGPFVCLSVSDSGCGIPREALPHIFEPFFTTKEVGKGTGLGLATVYGIVQQHQGWIEVSSQPGQGTTFHIYLPALASAAAPASAEASPPPARGGTETVFVVEDETRLRDLVRKVLEKYGYRVLVARSGMDALQIWQGQKENIQLLLTDLVMPDGMNGVELAGKLSAEKPGLKVIYTSGYTADVVGAGFLVHEEIKFLQKPYLPRELARIVRETLDAQPAAG